MRFISAFFLFIFSSLLASAQELISSGGESFSTTSVQLDFTLGELAIETLSANNQLTQGLHQGNNSVTALNELTSTTFTVFPNPTTDWIELIFNEENYQNGTLILTDLQGKVLREETRSNVKDNRLSLIDLSPGVYFIRMISLLENTSTLPIKIIKQ